MAVAEKAGEKVAPSEEEGVMTVGKLPVAVEEQRSEVPAVAGRNRSYRRKTGRV